MTEPGSGTLDPADQPTLAPAAEPDSLAPEPPSGDLAAAAAALTAAGYVVEAGGRAPARRQQNLPAVAALVVIAILAGAALFLSGYSVGNRAAATPGTPASDATLFAPFWDVWDSINHSYVGPIDRQKLVQGAIDGMMKALGDPFSSYMSPDALLAARNGLSGQFEGIGATMGTTAADGSDSNCSTLGPDCRLTVVAPIPGSPAENAGLQAHDVITRIDGTAVEGLTLDAATGKVRGPKDTTVVLTLVRGTDGPRDVSIVRAVILQPQVSSRELAGGTVRYIDVTTFSDRAAADFETEVKSALAAGVRTFVVDLRDNPGGYVTAARDIASEFIAAGPIFWEEDAAGNQVSTDASGSGVATAADIRVMVLVNKGSASASEIVAGALQDTGRAQLVGETTYGKGTMQEWMDLPDDAGGFRLTIARWLTPNKRWIHHAGLTPDVVVATDGGATTPTGDPYIDAALHKLGAATTARPARVARDLPAAA
jgi:carboxyl-terminal processing protease